MGLSVVSVMLASFGGVMVFMSNEPGAPKRADTTMPDIGIARARASDEPALAPASGPEQPAPARASDESALAPVFDPEQPDTARVTGSGESSPVDTPASDQPGAVPSPEPLPQAGPKRPPPATQGSSKPQHSKPRADRARAPVHFGTQGLGTIEVKLGSHTVTVPPGGVSQRIAVGKYRVRWRTPGDSTWSGGKRVKLAEGCELLLIIKPGGLQTRSIGTCR